MLNPATLRACAGLTCLLAAMTGAPVRLDPAVKTEAVGEDADDPAVWVHPTRPGESLVLGTNKAAAPAGALVAFGLDGTIRQRIAGLDRPNNVDVQQGIRTEAGETWDIAVVTERYRSRLRFYRIPRDGGALLEVGPVGGLPVFAGEEGERATPMGVALYLRPRDQAVFVIVSRKTGPTEGYLWQYRLAARRDGSVTLDKVRAFGRFSGRGEIEAVAVDDELGCVYYADEGAGIRKTAADPDAPDAGAELALFGTEGFRGDREGITILPTGRGRGYILCTDQIAGGSRVLAFRREGERGRPHDHAVPAGVLEIGADDTDGLDACAAPLGAAFPRGLLVAMNSRGRNFLLYRLPARLVP
jgi:3-phytase